MNGAAGEHQCTNHDKEQKPAESFTKLFSVTVCNPGISLLLAVFKFLMLILLGWFAFQLISS